MSIRIKEVEVYGFRAFNERIKVDLDYDIVLLIGGVGSGKSSFLDAIEYALYGTTYDVRERKSIRLEDLVNDFAREIFVRLKLIDSNGNEYEIVRRRKREGRPKVELYINGELVANETRKVEERLKEILGGITLDEFNRYIFIRREILDALIYGQPIRRSEAIDRLFGIASLEEAFRLMPLREVENEIKRIKELIERKEREISLLKRREEIEERLKEIDKELKEIEYERNRLQEEKIVYSKEYDRLREIEERYSRLIREITRIEGIVEQIKKDVKNIASIDVIPSRVVVLAEKLKDDILSKMIQFLAGAEAEEIERATIDETNILNIIPALRKALEKLEKIENEYRLELMDLSEQVREIKMRYEALRGIYERLESEVLEKEEVRERYEYILKKYGSRKDITRRVEELEEELERTRHEYEYEQALLRVLSRTLGILERMKKTECPVCLRELNEGYVRTLKERINKIIGEEEERVRSIPKKEKQLTKLKNILRELLDLEVKVVDLEDKKVRLEELEKQIEEEKRKLDELNDIINEVQIKLRVLTKFLTEANKSMRQLENMSSLLQKAKSLKEYERKLKALKSEIASLGYDPSEVKRTIQRLEEVNLRLRAIDSKYKELIKEREELERKIKEVKKIEYELEKYKVKMRKLEELLEQLRRIKYAYRSTQSLLRKRMLSRFIPLLNEVFSNIYPHKDYDALNVRVEVKRTSEGYERSIYEIMAHRTTDGAWVPVLSRLSDGQKALVALTFIITLSKLRPHNLGVLLLDEPIPNIDYECRKALMDTLSSTRIKQLIIATQNPEYMDIAIKGSKEYGLKSKVYKLRWTGKKGTIIEEC